MQEEFALHTQARRRAASGGGGKTSRGRVPPACAQSQEYFRNVYDHLHRINMTVESMRGSMGTATFPVVLTVSLRAKNPLFAVLMVAGTLMLAPRTLPADPYSWEWQLGLGAASGDHGPTIFRDAWLDSHGMYILTDEVAKRSDTIVSGTFHFSPVDDSRGPMAQARFIQRTSWVQAGYGKSSGDVLAFRGDYIEPAIPQREIRYRVRGDASTYFTQGAWIHAPSGWFLSGAASISDGNVATRISSTDVGIKSISRNDDLDGWAISIAAGKYVLETTTIEVGYGHHEHSLEIESHVGCGATFGGCTPLATAEGQNESEFVVAHVKHAGAFRDWGYALSGNVRARWSESHLQIGDIEFPPIGGLHRFSMDDDGVLYQAGGELYPLSNLGLLVTYGFGHEHSIEAGFRWFVVPGISLEASYVRSETTRQIEVDGWQFVFSGRY